MNHYEINEKMWDKLSRGGYCHKTSKYYNGLHDICEINLQKYDPILQLHLALVIDAAKNRDNKYLNGFFKPVMRMAGLNSNLVMEAFKQIWKKEDAYS